MKYVISWNERPHGSPVEYENAQKRILEVFGRGRRQLISRYVFLSIQTTHRRGGPRRIRGVRALPR